MRDRDSAELVLHKAPSAAAAVLVRVLELFEGHGPSLVASLQGRLADGCVAAWTACECQLNGRGCACFRRWMSEGPPRFPTYAVYSVMSARAAAVVDPRGLLWLTILGRHASILLHLAIRYRQPRRGSGGVARSGAWLATGRRVCRTVHTRRVCLVVLGAFENTLGGGRVQDVVQGNGRLCCGRARGGWGVAAWMEGGTGLPDSFGRL